jgi:signal transduction histidine kinase
VFVKRPWQIGLLFAACLAVLLAAVAWLSVEVTRLDRLAAEAREQAALEERMRLALWRLDSAVAPLLARENARPHFAYSAFYSAERAYPPTSQEPARGEMLLPSPLLTAASPHVRLYFQLDASGGLSSPQVPADSLRDRAVPRFLTHEQMAAADEQLGALRALLDFDTLAAALPVEPAPTAVAMPSTPEYPPLPWPEQTPSQQFQAQITPHEQQALMNQAELMARQRAADNFFARPYATRNEVAWDSGVTTGPLRPLWHAGELLLARRVTAHQTEYVQGVWLDWASLRAELLQEIADLFQQAALLPQTDGRSDDRPGMAALPLRLEARLPELPAAALNTPVRLFLVLLWIAILLAASAVAALLAGSIALSERRAAFVSAVTHELRTPLTTFQLYTDLLTAGLVKDEATRQEYLVTLRTEAVRLARLVENVLAFARLERDRASLQREPVAVGELLQRVRARLAERAALAEFRLIVEPLAPELANQRVLVDVGGVEQILFNLVDNACKYGDGAQRRDIVLASSARGGRVELRVRDFGSGVDPEMQKRLFRPFHKSAEAAAQGAPGVGLGLALSRQMARRMGGDLRLERSRDEGAVFVVELRAGS